MKLEYNYTASDGTKMVCYRAADGHLKVMPLYIWKQAIKKKKNA
jgi:hypothetical protein